MPIYGYRCEQCGHEVEVLQAMSDEPLRVCPNCMGPLRKMIYPAGIIFKGSGYYTTDYKAAGTASRHGDSDAAASGSSSSDGGSETAAKGSAPADSKSGSRSDSKPESSPKSKEASKPSPSTKPGAK